MATLVLSTVGTVLGGPVGGAIGALIGQSIDQQLLAPPTRGPRLGDLTVQTSSYGTDIPRIYGSMRVAGSVVWATDLVESEQTTGAKGQPDVTFSYSVSLAVALSSRVAGAVGRIWADGNLLRGAAGDFKVPTTFRFYDGGQNQDIDPLIASIEGIANTPAYRGISLAVFENLELAAFGNRIPFMTFEVIADPAPPAISSILGDASAGAIASDSTQALVGYAAYGKSISAAVQPLFDCFDIRVFDDGSTLRPPLETGAVLLGADDLGNTPDGQKASKIQRQQLPVRAVPSTLRLTYYDPDRDYQAGEARASAGDEGGNEIQQQLPAVLSADDAKTLTQQMMARQWSARDKLTLRLPPTRLAIEPGSTIEPSVSPASWIVEKSTIDGFVSIVEMRPSTQSVAPLLADAGRIVPNSDIVEMPATLALIDAPPTMSAQADGPVLLIAASSPNGGWSSRPLTVSGSGQSFATQTAARKSLLGSAVNTLAPADPFLIDEVNSVNVKLADEQQWLTSCDDGSLADGTNLAILGSELLQFGDATPLGAGQFRLSRLLRARGGTEWAMSTHSTDEIFCLIDGNSLRALSVPAWMRGSTLTAADRGGSGTSLSFGAESVRPLPPANLSAAIGGAGDLTLTWIRRSRSGIGWIDEIDVPIGESSEQYRIAIATAAASLELTSDQPTLVIGGAELAPLGSGSATIDVRQLGDWAASRPAQLTINLP